MENSKNFDVIIIGAGPAGYECALRCAELGARVAVVEKEELGGTCLNRGCIPTKSLLRYAHLLSDYQEAKKEGIFSTEAELSLEQEPLYAKKEKVVASLRSGIAHLFKHKAVHYFNDVAQIQSPQSVRLLNSQEEISCTKALVIATGSEVLLPPIEGIELALTSDDLLAKPHQFQSLAIIGGGVVGCELADYYARLGVEVHIFEALESILARMDADLSKFVSTQLFKRQGIKINCSCQVQRLEQLTQGAESKIRLHYLDKQQEAKSFDVDAVLCAVGRKAYTTDLFSESYIQRYGLPSMQRSSLEVSDKSFETSQKAVYALGDVRWGSSQLAHAASAEAQYLAEQLFSEQGSSIDLSLNPACIYLSPELASVGLSLAQAAEKGIDVQESRFDMIANCRTKIEGHSRSFIKLVYEKESLKILGAHLACERASDMIMHLSMAIHKGLSMKDLGDIIYPHPSYCEAFDLLASQIA